MGTLANVTQESESRCFGPRSDEERFRYREYQERGYAERHRERSSREKEDRHRERRHREKEEGRHKSSRRYVSTHTTPPSQKKTRDRSLNI